jgi:Fe-S cluster assembly iron-binding protein IscA
MIHVTEKAAAKIRELLQKDGVPAESGGLRVGVQAEGVRGLRTR